MSKNLSKEEELAFLSKLFNDKIITEDEFNTRKREIIYNISISDKNKTTAGLLALFLGGLGAHKFYLKNPVQGMLYLMFCWTFIPSIISFIEGLSYIIMDENRFRDKVAFKQAKEGAIHPAIILIPSFLLMIFLLILFPS